MKSKQLMLSNKNLVPTLQGRGGSSLFSSLLFLHLLHFSISACEDISPWVLVLEYLSRGFMLLPFVSIDVDEINFEWWVISVRWPFPSGCLQKEFLTVLAIHTVIIVFHKLIIHWFKIANFPFPREQEISVCLLLIWIFFPVWFPNNYGLWKKDVYIYSYNKLCNHMKNWWGPAGDNSGRRKWDTGHKCQTLCAIRKSAACSYELWPLICAAHSSLKAWSCEIPTVVLAGHGCCWW